MSKPVSFYTSNTGVLFGNTYSINLGALGMDSETYLYDMFCWPLVDDGSTPIVGFTYTIDGNETAQLPMGRYYSIELSGVQILKFYNNDSTKTVRIGVSAYFKTIEQVIPVGGSAPPPQFGGPSARVTPSFKARRYTSSWRSVHVPKIL